MCSRGLESKHPPNETPVQVIVELLIDEPINPLQPTSPPPPEHRCALRRPVWPQRRPQAFGDDLLSWLLSGEHRPPSPPSPPRVLMEALLTALSEEFTAPLPSRRAREAHCGLVPTEPAVENAQPQAKCVCVCVSIRPSVSVCAHSAPCAF